MSDSLHIIVKGRVQGVYFRVYTQQQAETLGVQGFVRNLSNGDVEIVAQGDAARLQQLVDWCWRGPALARVTDVIATSQAGDEQFTGFAIR